MFLVFKGSFGVKLRFVFLLPCGSALQVAKLLAWAFAILMAHDAGEELKKETQITLESLKMCLG